MFHVERNIKSRIIKGIATISLMVFAFISCVRINKNTEIADYQLLNSSVNSSDKKPKAAVFLFENSKSVRSFQNFLARKYNTAENRDFSVLIQNNKFIISVLDKSEVETFITAEDLLLRYQQPQIVKTGDRQYYIAITAVDKFGNDCLKNDSLYQNLVLNYLKELKLEFSKS